MRGARSWWMGVLAGLLLLPLPAAAQVPGRPPRAELQRRIRERFHTQLRIELGLDSVQARALREVMQGLQESRAELARSERELQARVARGLREGISDEEAEELLDRMAELRDRELRLWREEQERLGEVLSPSQRLRFLALRDRFAERVRAVRERFRGRPRPPGRRPPFPRRWPR